MKKAILLNFAIIVMLLNACAQVPKIEAPTKAPELLPGQNPTAIQLGAPLPDDQPWLLVAIDWKPYLISEDGEHRIEINPTNQFSENVHLNFKPSPTGKMVAIDVRGPLSGKYANLFLWSLADNSVTHITSLFSIDDPTIKENEDKDIFFSVGDMVWSHDGSKLAFTSAHLGATTDLYVYDLNSEEILWLTSGPTQAYTPVWSPDGAYILHAEVEHLNIGRSGSGVEGWQFYSAAPDGSQVHTLAVGNVEGQGFEEFLGWVSDRQMLMHSWHWICNWFDLRIMNIVSGEEYYIWHGRYNSIAYSPESGLALIFIGSKIVTAEDYCEPRREEPGLYLVTIPDGQVTEVPLDGFEADYYRLEVFDGKMPFFMEEHHQWYTVDAQGNIEEYDGNPILLEQFQKYENQIDQIYGWVSSAGLEIGE